jgi:hypothetical protein
MQVDKQASISPPPREKKKLPPRRIIQISAQPSMHGRARTRLDLHYIEVSFYREIFGISQQDALVKLYESRHGPRFGLELHSKLESKLGQGDWVSKLFPILQAR